METRMLKLGIEDKIGKSFDFTESDQEKSQQEEDKQGIIEELVLDIMRSDTLATLSDTEEILYYDSKIGYMSEVEIQ
jgi:hypothetical protein